jgi:hypothetical protein
MKRTIGAITLVGCIAALIGWMVVKKVNPFAPAAVRLHPLPDSLEPDGTHTEFVGHTWDAIRAKFGSPNFAWDGDYGGHNGGRTRNHPPEVKTMVYSTARGSRYLGFRQEAGEWVCSHQSWLPKGARF